MKYYAILVFNVFGLIVVISRFKKLDTYLRSIGVMLAITALAEILSTFLAFQIRNNIIIKDAQVILYSISYWAIYKNLIVGKNKALVDKVAIVALSSMIITYLLVGKDYEYNGLKVALQYLMNVVFTLVFFDDLLHVPTEQNILRDPRFWFNSGLFLYSCFSFVSISGERYFVQFPKLYNWMSDINYYLAFIFYGFIIALLITKNSTRTIHGN